MRTPRPLAAAIAATILATTLVSSEPMAEPPSPRSFSECLAEVYGPIVEGEDGPEFPACQAEADAMTDRLREVKGLGSRYRIGH